MAAIRRNIIDTLIRKGSCRICCGSAGPGLVSGEERRAIPMVVVSSTQHFSNTAQVHLIGSGPTGAVLRAVCIVD